MSVNERLLTTEQSIVLRSVKKSFNYVAKSKNNIVIFFADKPSKDIYGFWYVYNHSDIGVADYCFCSKMFDYIYCDDLDPICIDDILKFNNLKR